MGIRLDDYIGYCELGTLYGYGFLGVVDGTYYLFQ